MRRRLPLLATGLAVVLALSAPASAAILDVRIDTSAGPALCVSTSAGATSVSAVVSRPGGGSLVTVSATAPLATQCDGSAGRSFRPVLPFGGLDGSAGATLAITDSTGAGFSAPWPLVSLQTGNNGTTALLRARNLPLAAGTQITNGGSLPITAVTSGAFDSPGELATPDAPVTITATIAGTPFRAVIAPRFFAVDASTADGTTSVTVHGADPNGGPLALVLTAPDGGVLARTSANPRVGAALDAKATLGVAAPSGATIAASQGTWSTRTRFGVAAISAVGYTAAVLDPEGCAGQGTCPSGSWDAAFQLHDPNAVDPNGPCRALGHDISALPACGSFAGSPRTSVTYTGEVPVAGDTVTVTMKDATLGTTTIESMQTGAHGSLDDGGLTVIGAPRQPVVAAISSPRGALPALHMAKTALTDASGAATFGPERNAFPLHVNDGATVSLSGAGVGSVPLTYQYRLAAVLSGGVVSGTATPGARLLVTQHQGNRDAVQSATASATGAFDVALQDFAPGDVVDVAAGVAATHGLTTLQLIVGGFAPHIQGLVDQQPVHTGAVASVGGLPAGAGVFWGGDLPGISGGASLTLPVDRVPDGPARITATALDGPSATDYLYVVVDSTAPSGGAGPDQTVPIGRRVVFVTQARDANGLAAVRFRFTATGSGVGQAVNQLGQPFRHVFTKLGIYAVNVTITDLAGNTTADRAIVRVVKGVASTVSGRWPARAKRRAGIKTKLSARIPGDLSVQLIRPNGRIAVSRTLSFDKPRVGKKVTIALKRLTPGRYLAVRQFVDANGVAGPVVATPLVIA
jgi:hypothetical protein